MGILDRVEQSNKELEREAKLEQEFVELGFANRCPRDFLRKQKKGGPYRHPQVSGLHNSNSRKF